jgi:hypothetical protein
MFLGTTYQNGKNIPKWQQNIPNGHYIHIPNGSEIDNIPKWQQNIPNGH